MRVLLTTDTVGGVWRYSCTLAHELVALGHECRLAVFGDADRERIAELPEEVGVESRSLRLEWMPGGVEDVEAGTEWLLDVAGRWGAELVHLNQFAYAVGDFGIPTVVVAHSDVRSWFEEVRDGPAPAEWTEYGEVVRAGLGAADAVVAPTAYQAERLERHYGRSGARVIHNGIRVPAVGRDQRNASKRPMVLVAGRGWDEAKGVRTVEAALEALGPDAPTVHLVGPLEGPSGEKVDVERMVAHGAVAGSAMERFYQNARIYIAPSLYEPFGLAPLEAAAHGCSLLLSGIGSFRELWRDAATFFRAGDPESLARELMALWNDPSAVDERAWQARMRARTSYTAERMAAEYDTLYRELAGEERDYIRSDLRPAPDALEAGSTPRPEKGT